MENLNRLIEERKLEIARLEKIVRVFQAYIGENIGKAHLGEIEYQRTKRDGKPGGKINVRTFDYGYRYGSNHEKRIIRFSLPLTEGDLTEAQKILENSRKTLAQLERARDYPEELRARREKFAASVAALEAEQDAFREFAGEILEHYGAHDEVFPNVEREHGFTIKSF